MRIQFVGRLASAILLCLAPVGAAQTVHIAGPARLPEVGQTFAVTVSVTGGQRFANGLVGVSYDPAVVKYLAATPGSALGQFFSTPSTKADAVWAVGSFASDNTRTADGTLAVFTFEVLATQTTQVWTAVKTGNGDPDPGRSALTLKDGSYLPLTLEAGGLPLAGPAVATPAPSATARPVGGGVVAGPAFQAVAVAAPEPANPVATSAGTPPAHDMIQSVSPPGPAWPCGTGTTGAAAALLVGLVGARRWRR